MFQRLLIGASGVYVRVQPLLAIAAWIAFDPFVRDHSGVLLAVVLVCGYLLSGPLAHRQWLGRALGGALASLVLAGPVIVVDLPGSEVAPLSATAVLVGLVGVVAGLYAAGRMPRPLVDATALAALRRQRASHPLGDTPIAGRSAAAIWSLAVAVVIATSPGSWRAALALNLAIATVAVVAFALRGPVRNVGGLVTTSLIVLCIVAVASPRLALSIVMGTLVVMVEGSAARLREHALRNDAGARRAVLALSWTSAALAVSLAFALMPGQAWIGGGRAFCVEAMFAALVLGMVGITVAGLTSSRPQQH